MDWGTALSIALGGLLAVLGGMTTNRYARRRDAQAEMFILWDEMRLELGNAARNYEVVYKDDNWVPLLSPECARWETSPWPDPTHRGLGKEAP